MKTAALKKSLSKRYARSRVPPKHLHPEDHDGHEEGVARAERDADALASDFATELVRLVTTYPDSVAKDMLEQLRHHYWYGEWKSRGARKAGG